MVVVAGCAISASLRRVSGPFRRKSYTKPFKDNSPKSMLLFRRSWMLPICKA